MVDSTCLLWFAWWFIIVLPTLPIFFEKCSSLGGFGYPHFFENLRVASTHAGDYRGSLLHFIGKGIACAQMGVCILKNGHTWKVKYQRWGSPNSLYIDLCVIYHFCSVSCYPRKVEMDRLGGYPTLLQFERCQASDAVDIFVADASSHVLSCRLHPDFP